MWRGATKSHMKTDIEIAAEATVKPIVEVANGIGLTADDIVPYGKYIAKVPLNVIDRFSDRKDGIFAPLGNKIGKP